MRLRAGNGYPEGPIKWILGPHKTAIIRPNKLYPIPYSLEENLTEILSTLFEDIVLFLQESYREHLLSKKFSGVNLSKIKYEPASEEVLFSFGPLKKPKIVLLVTSLVN